MAYLSFICYIPDEEYDDPDDFDVVSLEDDKFVLRFNYLNKSSKFIYPSNGYYLANNDIGEFKDNVSKVCDLMLIDFFNFNLSIKIIMGESYCNGLQKKNEKKLESEKFPKRSRCKKS